MSINSVFGILKDSGVPFLSRQFGVKTLAFPVVGSLGGLFLFASNTDGSVLSEFSHRTLKVRYKLFGGVLLVHVTTDPLLTTAYISQALQHINLCIISQFGLTNLKHCQNADTLKTALSPSINPIINSLFGTFSCPGLCLMSYPVSYYNRDTKVWSNKLEKYLSILGTNYGCVFHGSNVHVISAEWLKLPFLECVNVLLTCSKVSLPPQKVLHKSMIRLPISCPDQEFMLVCNNYPPFHIFSLCPVELDDSGILSAFNKVFTAKDTAILVKDELTDRLKFDSAILGLTAVKNSENFVYVSEFCPDAENVQKILSYSVSRSLVVEELSGESVGDVDLFFSVNKNMNCHTVSREGLLISALFKPAVSQILSSALIVDVAAYFEDRKKKK